MFFEFLLVTAVIAGGSVGWSDILCFGLARFGWTTAKDELGLGIRVVLGMCVFLAAGGFLVAAHLAFPDLIIGWHLAGCAVALIVRSRRIRAARFREIKLRRAATVIATVGLGVVVAVYSLSRALVVITYNPNDDDGAYIYLAKRILETGALIDPFNQRRLVSFGGSSLYQSIWLRFGGDMTLQVFELYFCLLLIVVVTVRTLRRRWLLLGSVVIAVSVTCGYGVGPIVDVSPSFSGACFSLVFFQLLGLLRGERTRREACVYGLLGLAFAGAASLRIYFVLALLVAFVIVVAARRLASGVRSIAISPLVAVICLAGWSASDYASSGAALFPVFKGNYSSSYPGTFDPAVGFVTLVHRFWQAFSSRNIGPVMVLAAAFAVVAALTTARSDRNRRCAYTALFAAAIGVFVQLVVFTYEQSGSPIDDMLRFEAPSTLAVALFAIDLAWPLLPLETTAARFAWRSASVTVVALAVGLGMIELPFGSEAPSTYWATLRFDWSNGASVITGHAGFGERYSPGYLQMYQAMSDAVPQGSKVLAAVDYPQLLSFSRFSFSTLDIVGSVSPPPGMPLSSGPLAVAAYLRHLGYQYVVGSNFDDAGLYDIGNWENNIAVEKAGGYDDVTFGSEYAKWTTYFLDWQRIVDGWTASSGPEALPTKWVVGGNYVVKLG